jgi:hypothetical protein
MIDVEPIRAELDARLLRREISLTEYRRQILAVVRQWKREYRAEKDRQRNLELLTRLESGRLTPCQELKLRAELFDRWWKQTMRRTGLSRDQIRAQLADSVRRMTARQRLAAVMELAARAETVLRKLNPVKENTR